MHRPFLAQRRGGDRVKRASFCVAIVPSVLVFLFYCLACDGVCIVACFVLFVCWLRADRAATDARRQSRFSRTGATHCPHCPHCPHSPLCTPLHSTALHCTR